MRIHKFIADCGVCSRRAAEKLLEEGKVLVNGKPAQIGQEIDPEHDRVTCEGKRVRLKKADKRYFMFYKPRGVITSMKAQDDRNVVADLIAGIEGRVYPVGRLDKDSEGLLILTDDGEAAQKMMHPSTELPKTYRVTVKGDPTDDQLKRLREGIRLDDDTVTQPAEVLIHSSTDTKTVLYFTIREGKNRQIRRMCEEVGLEILLLKRIAIGSIRLGHLAPGAYRPLSHSEIRELLTSLGIDPAQKLIKKERPGAAPQTNGRKTYKRKSEKSIHERRFVKQFVKKK